MSSQWLAGFPRRAAALATGLIACGLLILTGQRALDAYRARQELETIRQEIASLRARNLSLQAELSSPRLDEEIERTARHELGLVRPGDHPVVLIWPAGAPRPSRHDPQPAAASEPNWRDWFRLFVDADPP